jgi:hypothetical protein
MPTKKTTKRSAKKAFRKSGINKTVEIHKALAATPDKGPKEISEELTAKGIDVTPGHVSTIKTNMKKAEVAAGGEPLAETATPKLKSVKTKRGLKKRVGAKKKTGRKKKAAAPQAAPAPAAALAGISYDDLQQAKDLARQLGGLDKAREALAALANLQE